MKRILLSRRVVLGAAAAATLGGGAFAYLNDEAAMVERTLAKHLPDAIIPRSDIAAFTNDFLKLEALNSTKMRVMARGLAAANGVLSFEMLRSLGPGSYQLEQLERAIVTFFVFSSDYTAAEGSGPRQVRYFSIPMSCINPWAKFECDENGVPV